MKRYWWVAAASYVTAGTVGTFLTHPGQPSISGHIAFLISNPLRFVVYSALWPYTSIVYSDRELDFIAVPALYIIHLSLGALCWYLLSLFAPKPKIKGLCPTCGYDLRATPSRCPECGREVKSEK